MTMFKRLILALVMVMFTFSIAWAAPVAAKVATIEGQSVQVTLQAEKPAWMKKGAQVKVKGVGPGKVAAIEGATITLTIKKAGDLKVGQELSIDKGGMSGC